MRPLVIGIGHSDRGDDHVGVEVVRRLADGDHDVDLLAWTGPPLLLLDQWQGRDVVLVDAMRSGRPAGSVVTLDETLLTFRTEAVSSHDIGVAQAVVLAKTLGLGPASLTFVGIEIAHRHLARRMSPEVADAVPTATAHVLACLDDLAVSDRSTGE